MISKAGARSVAWITEGRGASGSLYHRAMKRLGLLLPFALGACSAPPPPPSPTVDGGASFTTNCTLAEPTADAKQPAGRQPDGSVILPGGRRIAPAGRLLDVGGFPLALRVLPGATQRFVVVTDGAFGDEALRIVDLQAADPHAAVVSSHAYPSTAGDATSPALFYGLALTADGTRLFASNGGYDPAKPGEPAYNTIDVFDFAGSPPQLSRNDAATIRLAFNTDGGVPKQRLPAGLTLSSDEKLLYVAGQSDNTLAIIDLAPGPGAAGWGAEIGRATLPGIAPYDVALDEAHHTAWVSLWGGQTVGPNKYLDGIVPVDVTNPKAPKPAAMPIATGKAAEAELIVGGRLLVANADADTVSSVDLASRAVTSNPVASPAGLVGSTPNALAADVAASRLYVANANDDAVEVLDLATLAPKGRIPTAWYPTAVAVLADGSVVIASAKGMGLGPTDHEKGKDDFMQGTLQVVPRPSDADLAMGEAIVAANLARPTMITPQLTCPASGEKRFPLPPDAMSPTPIQHVFLIVRENKTYDAILGDLPTGNGDPKLVLFGADVTPNAHALATTFASLDNFYANAEQSLQGHEWTTAAFSNDYSEKGWLTTWGRATRSPGAFASGTLEHLPHPPGDTAWTHLDKAGVPYRNYGEIVNTAGALTVFDVGYPGVFFDTSLKDVDKIQYVIGRINDPTLEIERFSYIGLPNDHTVGTVPGKPTPQSMVADNDEATGRFVDALSHSGYWPSSIVFVIEDDPQDGGDHVEGHRSLCLAISPWVKRGYTSSVHGDDPALWRTIDLLLGVGPMNAFEANASALYDLFSTTPDLTPYSYLPRKVAEALNGQDAPLAEESLKIDFSKPDSAPLGRILWRAVRGQEPPWGAKDSPRAGMVDLDD